MKAVINVKGTKLSVLSIHYHCDEIHNVTAIDENGNKKYFYDEKTAKGAEDVVFVDLKTALEYPELEARIVEERTELIQLLEDGLDDEKRKLHNILVEMGALKDDAPFSNLGVKLLEKHTEHTLKEQRVFGIIDTVEKVKAYTEGFYANDNDPTVEA